MEDSAEIRAAEMVGLAAMAAAVATKAKGPLTPYSNRSPWIIRNERRRYLNQRSAAFTASKINDCRSTNRQFDIRISQNISPARSKEAAN
jgi:hypothetical protein